ncbi:hypothetical protein B0J12DRAFT_651798 [Macrophomina phaseolina]|uniref:U4/U6.U5 small nuclear ribonucleoprotein 27kDa protein domain-containing protein n=1 Tax=Macrophomina phaseolina TaxID=35725 RepID=A0ABQ8GL55_9PEZI|nr:hypothetical protein B0J12DRAFT_651798 [Macrophomina phaseolina]
MAEPAPPNRRSRRPDSAQMWDDDDRSSSKPSRRGGPGGSARRDNRSRSPRGGDRRRRDRSASRERGGGRRRDGRSRSRSPRPSDARDNTRRRSPPRGPRGTAPATNGVQSGGAAGKKQAEKQNPTAGRTQPSSREWTRRVQARANGVAADGQNAMDVDDKADGDEETRELERLMGFSSFSSTSNTKVPGNDRNYAVRKEKKTEYRQYMNRTGGFNRPLSPSR